MTRGRVLVVVVVLGLLGWYAAWLYRDDIATWIFRPWVESIIRQEH